MKRPRFALSIAFLLGFLFAIGLLALARSYRPAGRLISEDVEALSVALEDVIPAQAQGAGKDLYVESDVEALLVPKLQQLHPTVKFHMGRDRPPSDGCNSANSTDLVFAPCEPPDYISANVSEAPLWRTVQVHIGYSNGGCQMVLFKIISNWRVGSKSCVLI
jgi:hypothetical protein